MSIKLIKLKASALPLLSISSSFSSVLGLSSSITHQISGKVTLKRPPLPSEPPDPSESRRPPSFLPESGVDRGLRPRGAEEPTPVPPSGCPSVPLSDKFLCGLGFRDFSPKRVRPLTPDEEPLMAPAILLKTGEDDARLSSRSRAVAAGRNQSAQDRQGVGGAFRRSSIAASKTSSCRRVALTCSPERQRGD